MHFDIHLPNHTYPFSKHEMETAVQLNPSSVVALVYERGVVPQHNEQIREIVARTGARLILRPYEPAPILHWRPIDWGHECAERVVGYVDLNPVVVCENEPNHEDDGGVTDPGRIAEFWVMTALGFQDAMDRVFCPIELAIPSLSPIGNYKQIYRSLKGVIPYFARTTAHVYARCGNWNDPVWLRELFGKPVDVTEWDSWMPTGYLPIFNCLDKMQADAKCWFILSSTQFAEFDLMRNMEAIMMAQLSDIHERVKLLEKQQSLTVDLTARILSGKWTGGAESAQALLLAISPKLADEQFKAAAFPHG